MANAPGDVNNALVAGGAAQQQQVPE